MGFDRTTRVRVEVSPNLSLEQNNQRRRNTFFSYGIETVP